MQKTRNLTDQEIKAALTDLPSWKLDANGQRLEADFRFKSFPEAISFMTRVAFEAERLGHHPDWFNSYNRVKIQLMTHDSEGITDKDIDLARCISLISWV